MKKEKEMLKLFLTVTSYARRSNLKLNLINRIITLLTTDSGQTESEKWGKMSLLQKKMKKIKIELGEMDYNILIQEVIEIITEYLTKNLNFKKEAFQNFKSLSIIQKAKEEMMKNIFKIDNE